MVSKVNAGQVKFSSWGRTRGPKNLAGSQGGVVTTVAQTDLVKITADENKDIGYFTENQRYLHVLLEDANTDAGAPQAITVFGYSHAFTRWFPLSPSHATAETPAGAAASAVPAPTHENVDPGNDAFLPEGRIYRVYEILGIDKVAFVGANNDARTTIFAACSTF